MRRLLLLAVAAAWPAWAQFELYLVNGNIEQPIARAYDFGAVEPGGSLAVPFRIRNVSNATATLDLLTVSGAGFSLASGRPAIPLLLVSEQAIDFTVVFQSAGTGSYSAALDSVGIGVILSAEVPVELTCQLATAAGVQPLASAPVDFGSVAQGASAARHIVMANQTSVALMAPGPLVTGAGFSLGGPSPGGTLVQPTASVAFDIQFSPAVDGTAAGTLTIGIRSYSLTAIGVDAPLPHPQISLSIATLASAQQGTASVTLDAPAQIAATGTLTMAGLASDPGISFASGGLSATFTVAAGDTQGHFGGALSMPFQTGTTAGALTFTVQLGSNSNQQSIAIPPAAVGLTAALAVRSVGAVEVDLTGFDNTRTAGALSFTFYDGAGNALAPAIPADGGAAFASYFQTSAGGTFALKATFPVIGDTSLIKSFQAAVTNSAGTATTARTGF